MRHGNDKLILYACSHACSLAAHVSLELVGAQFEVQFINLWQGQQRTTEYLRVNPRGKVPALAIGDIAISENVAILAWLAERFPDARLLPQRTSIAYFDALADLAWISSSLHPALTRMVVPHRFVSEDHCNATVRATAIDLLRTEFERVDVRLARKNWWLEQPSAVDAYLLWVWARAQEADFDTGRFTRYADLVDRMLELDPVRRALRRERAFMPCYPDLN